MSNSLEVSTWKWPGTVSGAELWLPHPDCFFFFSQRDIISADDTKQWAFVKLEEQQREMLQPSPFLLLSISWSSLLLWAQLDANQRLHSLLTLLRYADILAYSLKERCCM